MKKRIITVLITIFTVIPLVLITPKAASSTTSTTTVNSYGQYFYTYGCSDSGFDLPIIGRVAWNSGSYITFTYEFLREYDGFINFTLKANKAFAWQNCYFTVEGGVFTSQPNMTNSSNIKTFQIQFQNSTGFTLTIAKQEAFTLVSDSTFGTNTSITLGTYNFNTVPDVPDTLDHISDRFDFYIPGMSTSLSNIDSDLDNISQNIQALSPYIDQLEGYVDGLEGLLSAINTSTSNLSALSIPIYSYSAYYYALKYGTFYNNYSTWAGASVGVPTIILNRYATPSYDSNYSFVIPAGVTYHFIYVCSGNPVFDYYQENVGLINSNNLYYDFISGWRMYDLIYTNETDNAISMSICMSRNAAASVVPLYFGSRVPEEIGVTYDIDFNNKYTRLLQSINNGIGALNDDYDTSAYDNYEQTLDGLNDGLRGRFDNVDDTMQNNVNTLFTPSGTAGSDGSIFEKFNFNGVNSVFTGILNGIFTSFPAFKYILLFALLLLVIGVMV